jgi:hypothetical protein
MIWRECITNWEDVEGNDGGLSELPLPGETKGKSQTSVLEGGNRDRTGSVFGSGSHGRVHCRLVAFAMLNIQVSPVSAGMFLFRGGARLTRIEATGNNFAFVNIFLLP